MLLLLGQGLLSQSAEVLDLVLEVLVCFLQFLQFLSLALHRDVLLELVPVELPLEDVEGLASGVGGLIEEGLIVDAELVLLLLQQTLMLCKSLPYQLLVILCPLHLLSLLPDPLLFSPHLFALAAVRPPQPLHLLLPLPHFLLQDQYCLVFLSLPQLHICI